MKKYTFALTTTLIMTLTGTAQVSVTSLAGSIAGYANGIGLAAQFSNPNGVATDSEGNVYVADTSNSKIRKITPAGMVSTIAGSTQGFADGIGSAARFSGVQAIAIDTDGNVYVTDSSNYKIRKITADGMVSTLAGSTQGFADGIGTQAQFYFPQGVTTDVTGNIYVADSNNYKIRKITPAGFVTTIAGSTVGFADGIGDVAQFVYPTGLATDAVGNLYVADYGNHKIRKIMQQLDVVQNNIASKIVIFPNPVTNVLTLQLENSCIIDRISISDFSGKIILTQTQNTT
jgi:sugar lactone lactonase YvrE